MSQPGKPATGKSRALIPLQLANDGAVATLDQDSAERRRQTFAFADGFTMRLNFWSWPPRLGRLRSAIWIACEPDRRPQLPNDGQSSAAARKALGRSVPVSLDFGENVVFDLFGQPDQNVVEHVDLRLTEVFGAAAKKSDQWPAATWQCVGGSSLLDRNLQIADQ